MRPRAYLVYALSLCFLAAMLQMRGERRVCLLQTRWAYSV